MGRPLGDTAASEVVGSVLLVALSVVSAGALSVLVLSVPGPVATPHVELVTTLDPGADRLWNTSDERIIVSHRGGDPLFASEARIFISTPRTQLVRAGDDLGFASGAMRIGQRWESPLLTLVTADAVSVRVVAGGGAGSLLANADLVVATGIASCSADVAAPAVASWTQSPSDITTNTTGAITVKVDLADACAGIDQSVIPSLFYRVNGTQTPAFSSTTMTSAGNGSWTATVLGSETWGWRAGASLEYYVSPLRDLRGNEGASALQRDLVEDILRYPASSTTTTGTLTDFSALQNATDAGAVATLRNAGSAGVIHTHNATTSPGSGAWLLPANGFASDDLHATTTSVGETVRYTLEASSQNGSLERLVLRAEVSGVVTGGPGVDKLGFQLQACLGAACTPLSGMLQGSPWTSGTDALIAYDVTSLRPGGGAWQRSDLASVELRVTSAHETGSTASRVWRIDRAWADAHAPATSALAVETTFAPVPAASFHVLEVRHRTENASYQAEIWNGSAWNTRGILSNATLQTWSIPLTQSEAEQTVGAGLRVRFVHATVVPAAALHLDYVRVRFS